MPRFGDVAALTSYLHRLDEDYDAYAQALWASGIRRSEQLANNTVAALMTAGISNELHAGDIKARSGGDIAGAAGIPVDYISRKLLNLTRACNDAKLPWHNKIKGN
eukprot:GHUV01000788.1.p1 GENE.GHUV01000788.1~~GHUV01000788.1.p1  ORF type:complete len:106 (+),score=24.10 GHUV01000788.1:266-583(+)